MLDVVFYSSDDQMEEHVELSEDLYLWLARSDFARIGNSQNTQVCLDGESVELPLVKLEDGTRQRFANFLRDQIVAQTDVILTRLGDEPSKEEYQDATYPLKKLQELRKCVEDERYFYLQRV